MKVIDISQTSAKDLKKIMTGVIARPVSLVTSLNEDYSVNIGPFSFFNMLSFNPPVVAISVLRNVEGSMKDTTKNIINERPSRLHIVTEGIAREANLAAVTYPYGKTEKEYAGLRWGQEAEGQAPMIEGALVAFDVKLLNHQIFYSQEEASTDFLILSVNHIYLDESIIDEKKLYIKYEALAPVLRLAGNDYAKLGDIFQEERPE